jgi:hypothetical protein
MRRALLALAIFVAGAVAGVVGGVALAGDGDEEPEVVGISDAEHERLVDACESYGGDGCYLYVAELVAWGEPRGLGYEELLVALDEDEQEAADRADERERRRRHADVEGLEDWADRQDEDADR